MMDKPLRLSDFKALTFDVGGTLIDIESGILNWFRPHLVRYHLEISDSTLLEAFAQAEEKYLNLLPQISFTRILPVVYREIAESCGLTPREADGEEVMQSVKGHLPLRKKFDGDIYVCLYVLWGGMVDYRFLSEDSPSEFFGLSDHMIEMNVTKEQEHKDISKAFIPIRITSGSIFYCCNYCKYAQKKKP